MSAEAAVFSLRIPPGENLPERITVDYGTHGHAKMLEIHLPDGRVILISHGIASNGYEVAVVRSMQALYDGEHDAQVVAVDADNNVWQP